MMMQAAPIPVPVATRYTEIEKPEPLVDIEAEPGALTREATPEPHILHDLTVVDRLLITKRLRVKNVLFLRGKKNRFFVRTPDQNLIYTIEEENSWWVGYFCYGLRPLQLRVINSQGAEVMRIHRPYSCTSRVLPCQLQRLQVYSPPGQLIGSVEQQWTAIKPTYLVKNDNGDHVFWIRGPYITLSCFRDVQFQIVRADGAAVGATCKRWQGLTHALFFAPVTDKFGVAFEKDLSVEQKALLLAATLLMDYMYYDA
ncbi:phospholipid scramblase 2-like isoform X2 [Trichoplusia ni]|uniref:Phospholipid scramblase n=1 Tax=Trichoplusia ni TaxID=7111 RepID=A0A7E5VQT0_TRINI|nr:phospholipid scramblase 2-like isoform X2 [Trichoplusia ni]